jgi:hypothetical protein
VTHLTCVDGATTVLDVAAASGSFSLPDGTHPISCTATDSDGNQGAATDSTAMPAVFDIDQTPPTLNPTVNPNPVLLQGAATVTANAADAPAPPQSGLTVDSVSCGPLDTASIGTHQVTCSAADGAGNTAQGAASYAVDYDFGGGFLDPVANPPTVNSVKAGATVPLKFSLGGDLGLDLFTPGFPQVHLVACTGGATNDVPTVAAGNSGLQYDPLTDVYTYVWKTDRAWAGRCGQLELGLNDGTTHTVSFQFR